MKLQNKLPNAKSPLSSLLVFLAVASTGYFYAFVAWYAYYASCVKKYVTA